MVIRSITHLRRLEQQHKSRNKRKMNKSAILPCDIDRGENKELKEFEKDD